MGSVLTPPPRPDRRGAERRPPREREPLQRLRLRTGREVAVLNVSTCGVLVEGTARLLPGTHLDVHVVTTAGRVLVRTRVMRAWVSMLEKDELRYRCALAFQQPVDISDAGYALPGAGPAPVAVEGSPYPGEGQQAMAIAAERLSA